MDREINIDAYACEIPEEDAKAMWEFYYGEDPLTVEMRENGVSWKDFI